MPPTITTQRIWSRTWHRSKGFPLNQINDHRTQRIWSRTWHRSKGFPLNRSMTTTYKSELQDNPPNSSFLPFPNKVETQFSAKQEQTIITNHLKIRLTSRNYSNSWRSQSLSNDHSKYPFPRTEQKWCSRHTNEHHPSSITDECQRTKNSVNPGWVEPDSN